MIRKAFVPATAEELIRQKLLGLLIGSLGYPKELIAVERQLSQLPHLAEVASLPNRRADLLCYAKLTDYYPLLLIECKEGKIKNDAISQVLGYNHFVRARFVAVVASEQIQLIYPYFSSSIPHYSELCLNA